MSTLSQSTSLICLVLSTSSFAQNFQHLPPQPRELIEQPPMLNSPLDRHSLGVERRDQLPARQADDVVHSYNRIGAGYVLPHSGQAVLDSTDLFLSGRDSSTDLMISRRHLTRINHEHSIFGPAWAFNYQITLQETSLGDVDLSGFGRTDRFNVQPGGTSWLGTAGRFGHLFVVDANTLILRRPGGSEWEFTVEQLPSGSLVGHVTRIVSPNTQNFIVIGYEPASAEPELLARRIVAITESYGRQLLLEYTDPDFGDGVSRIVETFSGREVLYDYNTDGQLLSMRSPTVTSTFGLNDFAGGKTTLYRYVNHSDPRLKNALDSVVAPNQEATPAQVPRITWRYRTGPPSSPEFGYVENFTLGTPGGGTGGTYTYTYGFHPRKKVEVVDRRGTTTNLSLNRLGQVLQEEIETQGLRPSQPSGFPLSSSFRWRHGYNSDGDLLQSLDPFGALSIREQSNSNLQPRLSHGNQEVCSDLVGIQGGDQPFLKQEVVYEPVFNLPFRIIAARGFEPGNLPENFTTTYIYDYMEDLAQAKIDFAPRLGLSQAELQTLFDDAGITALFPASVDLNGDGLTDQQGGNLIELRSPPTTLPAEASLVGVDASQPQLAVEGFVYNDFGQLIQQTDALGQVDILEYFDAADPDGPAFTSGGGGYIRRVLRDVGTFEIAPICTADPVSVNQVTSFEYGVQPGVPQLGISSLPANPRGIPTAIIDPRQVKHTRLVNELDQVVIRIRAAEWPLAGGLAVQAYLSINRYDANNNVVETRVQNKDTLVPAVDDFIVNLYQIDLLDQRIAEVLDFGHEAIPNIYTYDESQNLVSVVRAANKPEQVIEEWTYDERDIVVTHTRGAGSPEASTTTTLVDDAGNLVGMIDADGAHVSSISIDGYNRPKTLVDRRGNTTELQYDSASNMIQVVRSDATSLALAISERSYDERNRPVQEDRSLFHTQPVGVLDAGALGNPLDGRVSTVNIHDEKSRLVGVVDADADVTIHHYDGLHRRVCTIDAAGNRVEYIYDKSSNLIEMTRVESEAVPVSVTLDEIFIDSMTYDALNRLIEWTEPIGQTTTISYDSRDNPIKRVDALLNEVEYSYDRLDRMLEKRTYLSPSGLGASAAGSAPFISTSTAWDSLWRAVVRTDDKGNTTTYVYDDLSRRIETQYADGTSETWDFNADSELLTHVTANGSVETYTRDANGNATTMAINNSAASTTVAGSTLKTWTYDGLDRAIQTFDNNGFGEDVTCDYLYDSLSRVIRETQTISGMAPLNVDTGWQGSSRLVSHTYPDGREVDRSYDSLDRLFEIREGQGSGLIASFQYVGPGRDLLTTYGNGTVLDKRDPNVNQTQTGPNAGYDKNGRHVRHEWKDGSGTTITSYLNSYNGVLGVGTSRRVEEVREHIFNNTDSYTFDSAYRMTAFLRDGGISSTRNLDGTDKMTSFIDEGTAQAPVLDVTPGMNQYVSFDGSPRTYEDSGSLKSDSAYFYVYDSQNRLVAVSNGSIILRARYVYTADGRRVLRAVGSGSNPGTTRYLYAGRGVIEERDSSNTLLRQYVDGRVPSEHIQLLDHSTVAPPLAVPLFYHSNSQGSVGALTDPTGTPVEYYEYSWLGRPRIIANLKVTLPQSFFGNSYMFQGRRYDSETQIGSELNGLYWHGDRYYSPQTGEYITNGAAGNWSGGQGNGYGAFGGDGWNMRPWDGPSLEEVFGPLTPRYGPLREQPQVYGPFVQEDGPYPEYEPEVPEDFEYPEPCDPEINTGSEADDGSQEDAGSEKPTKTLPFILAGPGVLTITPGCLGHRCPGHRCPCHRCPCGDEQFCRHTRMVGCPGPSRCPCERSKPPLHSPFTPPSGR